MNVQKISRQLLSLELWFLLILAVFSFFWFQLLPVIVLVALVFWVIRLLAYGYLSVRTPADWGIALLCLAVLVSVYISAVLVKTIPQVWRLLSGIALFYAIANWGDNQKRIKIMYRGFISAGFGLALLAPFTVLWVFDKITFIPESIYENFTVLVSDSANPSVMAGSLVLLLPFPLALLLFCWKNVRAFERILSILAVILIFGMLILTRARGAWVAAGAVLLTLLILFDRRFWILVLLGCIATLALGFFIGNTQVLDALLYSNTVGGLEGRLEIWARAVTLAADFPFSGVGMGSFQEAAEAFYAYDQYAPAYIPHAHNLFLQVGVDLGIPGLVAWCSILMGMFYIAWRIASVGKRKQNAQMLSAGGALLASQVALVSNGLTDAVVWGMVRPAPLVWILWGFGAAIASYSLNKEENVQY
jgi:putative inorganic carbon (HCO3(-)) transporter